MHAQSWDEARPADLLIGLPRPKPHEECISIPAPAERIVFNGRAYQASHVLRLKCDPMQ